MLHTLLIFLALAIAAVSDAKRSEIPNLSLLLLCPPIFMAIAEKGMFSVLCSLLLLGVPLLFFAVKTDQLGGGDVKLLSLLSAACGGETVLWLAVLALLLFLLYHMGIRRRKNTMEPLAPCIFIAFIILKGAHIIV